MHLHFDPNQKHQLDAIDAMLRVFEGQPADCGGAVFTEAAMREEIFPETWFANRLYLSEEQVLKNVRAVQKANGLEVSDALKGMHFSVEMETGTGKTYVYLRTIYELHKQYGFRKFVVVVPSVAIREGVLKNLRITHDHLQNLYGKPPARFEPYDSNRVSLLRHFALSDALEILVINIDSFAKDENVINRPNDKLMGERPVDFIRRAKPVVIVDEPQNMETERRRRAIENLNYLCTLRYSATHTRSYHMIYSLDPVRAYDLGLVKRIEVSSVVTENDFNYAYVRLKKVKYDKRVSAVVEIDCRTKGGVKRKPVTVGFGKDLYDCSGKREIYRTGYVVNEIDADRGFVTLSGGRKLSAGETIGGLNDAVMKAQIRETVSEHFAREAKLRGKGIKVLSLFFIDRVANYRGYGDADMPIPGKFARWFEEAYRECSGNSEYADAIPFRAREVHGGYFSKDKGKWKDTRGNTLADDDTFQLIMRDKERLLDPNEPLRFIFSHSALREGWDNPNVFQICTLNETQSEMKKRQEIGRGMRLAVDSGGNRIQDTAINRLTVIANESYEVFARQLQQEIEQECGVAFGDRIKDKRKRKRMKYRKGFQLDEKFRALWDRIKYRTTYRVRYDTGELVRQAAQSVRNMPVVQKPSLRIGKAELEVTAEEGVQSRARRGRLALVPDAVAAMPDILSYLQERTWLTRSAIHQILLRSRRLADALLNPQMFVDHAADAIKTALSALMEPGIKYQRIGAREYEMRLFEEYDFYPDTHTFRVGRPDKTIYAELVPLDSGVESDFACDCEGREDIEFYFKLPPWFKIKTPIGNYNPDWALIKKGDKTVYFVAETKSAEQELRVSERSKIRYGRAHFAAVGGVEYRRVSSVGELD